MYVQRVAIVAQIKFVKKIFVNVLLDSSKAVTEPGVTVRMLTTNRPFPRCLLPQFQNESSCEINETLICMKIDVEVEDVFI